jgi:hypothetical protein
MSISQTGPANKRAGVKTGKAPHPVNTPKGFDQGFGYAEYSKTKVGIGKDKKKG